MNANPGDDVRIVKATENDVPLILGFVRKLAEYEKLSHEVAATEEALRRELFGGKPAAEVLIAYVAGNPVGFALYFYTFSTFLGKRGIYLEDLFVDLPFRGRGIGRALLQRLAGIANDSGCGRLEWSVLNWNAPSIEFYRRLGAVVKDEWSIFRIAGKALEALAESRV